MKKFLISILSCVFLLTAVSPAFAHVVVRPNTANVAAFQTFTVGVPVEKEVPTTSVRLVIPEGLQHVTPNVKPGWTIDVTREGEGEAAKVTEIIWSGGSIPVGQRDEFVFSAQLPAQESTLAWKAYQTYEDGTVVSWDQDPAKEEHGHGEDRQTGPWSETKVVNDLANVGLTATEEKSAEDRLPLVLSIAALLLAGTSVWMQSRKKR
jgi:uncharacterized protein YcnI